MRRDVYLGYINYQKGKSISGLDPGSDSLVFHAGTAQDRSGVISSGGRVLAVTSFGRSIPEACDKSYETISKIRFEGMYYRKDIGKDLATAVKEAG